MRLVWVREKGVVNSIGRCMWLVLDLKKFSNVWWWCIWCVLKTINQSNNSYQSIWTHTIQWIMQQTQQNICSRSEMRIGFGKTKVNMNHRYSNLSIYTGPNHTSFYSNICQDRSIMQLQITFENCFLTRTGSSQTNVTIFRPLQNIKNAKFGMKYCLMIS